MSFLKELAVDVVIFCLAATVATCGSFKHRAVSCGKTQDVAQKASK